jgi:hypothetical protein
MTDRSMLTIVATALLMGAGILLFERNVARRGPAAAEDSAVFPGIAKAAIAEVTLNAGGRRVSLKRLPDGTWEQIDPVRDRVDPRQLDVLLDALADLRQAARPEESRGGKVIDPAEYELADPAAKIVVTHGEGERRRTDTLALGKVIADSGSAGGLGRVYARLNDETDRVLILGDQIRNLAMVITRDIHAYRSRLFFDPAVLEASRGPARGLLVRTAPDAAGKGDLTVLLTRPAGWSPYRWELTGIDAAAEERFRKLPIGGETPEVLDRADPARIDALLSALADLRIERFVEESGSGWFASKARSGDAGTRMARFGLADAGNLRAEVRLVRMVRALTGDGRTVLVPEAVAGLAISNVPVEGRPDLVYARRERPAADGGDGDRGVYAVRKDFLDRLPKDLDALREPAVLPDTVAEIRSATLRRGDATVAALTREGARAAGRWQVGGSKADADGEVVDRLLNALRTAKVVRWADWVGTKFNPETPIPDEYRLDLELTLKPGPGESVGRDIKLTVWAGRFPEPKPADPAKPDAVREELVAVQLGSGDKRENAVRLVDAAALGDLKRTRLEFYAKRFDAREGLGEVAAMTLIRPDGRFELENRGKDPAAEWWVKSPYMARADGAVSNWPEFFARMDDTRIRRVAGDDPTAAARFGLARPEYQLTLTGRRPPPGSDRPKSVEIRVGRSTASRVADDVGPRPPAGDGPAKPEPALWFVRVGDEPLIFEIGEDLAGLLGRELRDGRVPDFAPDEKPAEVSVDGPGVVWTLVRAAGKPHMHEDGSGQGLDAFRLKLAADAPGEEIHADRVPEAVSLFAGFSGDPLEAKALRAERFLSHTAREEDMPGYGLDKPEFTVGVLARAPAAGGKPERTVKREWHIGREIERDGRRVRAMRRPGDSAVFVLGEADLKRLLRPAADWRTAPPKPEGGLPVPK